MKSRFAAVTAGVATLATTGALLLAGAGVANAATPPYQGSGNQDPNQVGTLTFYNSAGVQITTGSVNTGPLAAYYAGSTADPTHTKATQYFYTPKNGVAPGAWPNEQASLSTTYPNLAAPAPINGEGSNPVVTGAASDETLATYITDVPNTDTSNDGYAGLYQVRVKTSSSGQYQAADIMVTGSTWTEVFGTAIATSTTLTSNDNPSNQGDTVTFTATETGADSSHPAGSVQFAINGSNSGSPVATSGAGVATLSTTALNNAGSPYNVTATFTPTAGASVAFPNYAPSTSPTLVQKVNAPAPPTTTTLGITGNATTGTDATLSGTVSPSSAAGTVEFFDNGSATPIPVAGGPSVPVTGGNYTATLTGGFAEGSHSVVAKFTPTDPTAFASSQSPAQVFTTVKAGGTCQATGSQCSDVQGIQGEIPTGTLVISTPYTPSQPLDVGTMQLNGTGTQFTASKTFQCITITDSNGVNTGFKAQAQSSDLSKTAGPPPAAGAFTSIDSQNVGLTNLVPSAAPLCQSGQPPVNSYTGGPGSITPTDNPAATPAVAPGAAGTQGLGNVAHTVLTGSPNGVGTATYDGTLTLNAPTSTATGTYDGTINFTVSDGE